MPVSPNSLGFYLVATEHHNRLLRCCDRDYGARLRRSWPLDDHDRVELAPNSAAPGKQSWWLHYGDVDVLIDRHTAVSLLIQAGYLRSVFEPRYLREVERFKAEMDE